MSARSFETAGHPLFDHLHCFLDGFPRIFPLDPVEFLQGNQCPGIPEHAQCPGSFQPHPCIIIPQGVNQRLHGPGIPQPSQRFSRIPPHPFIIIGEPFDKGFKSIRRDLSPSPGGLSLCGAWGEMKVLAGYREFPGFDILNKSETASLKT